MIIKVSYLLGIYTATVRQLANLIHLQDLRNNIKLTTCAENLYVDQLQASNAQ